jgi:hypothetical protein
MGPRRCRNDPWIVEKSFDIQIIHQLVVQLQLGSPREDEVIGAIAQSREGKGWRRDNATSASRPLPGETVLYAGAEQKTEWL